MCEHTRIAAKHITRNTMRRLDLRGTCFECWLDQHPEDTICLQHAESECVFLLDKDEDPDATFWYECDEIPANLFFRRIEDGYSYDLLY